MNTSELLDQFIQEAREGLETIGQRLLDVERDPANAELLNDLFRQVHTLKGNCGLFDFKPLETVVHAGEDLLDRVRNGSLAYSGAIADALLEAMDYTAELIDTIAQDGALPAGATPRAQTLAAALRQHLAGPAAAAAVVLASPAAALAAPAVPLPDWAADLPSALQLPGCTALRYQPEPECFFKGEDPWHLARNAPGLRHLAVRPAAPWSVPEAFDCYRCNLDLLIVSDAPVAELEAHFRYVPEQLQWHSLQAPFDGPAVVGAELAHLRGRIAMAWDEQRALLARPGIAAGTVAAARRVLANLLQCWGDEALNQALRPMLDSLPAGAQALATWALQHRPSDATGADIALLADTAADAGQGSADGGSGNDGAGAPASVTELKRGATPPDDSGSNAGGHKVLKVGQDKIDRLMDLIGEMVVAKNALPYLAQRAEDVFKQRELAREIKTQYSVINRIAEDMQHAIMQVRMLPVGTIFQRFGRPGARHQQEAGQGRAAGDRRRGHRGRQECHREPGRPADPHPAQQPGPRHRAACRAPGRRQAGPGHAARGRPAGGRPRAAGHQRRRRRRGHRTGARQGGGTWPDRRRPRRAADRA